MKKIFITGCAKTRTTLVQQLMFAFADTVVIPGESLMAAFQFIGEERVKCNIVIKRWATDWLANHPCHSGYVEGNIKTIFVTRNREDTLKSDNGYVKPFRYDGVHKMAELYRDYISFWLDSDLLIKNPDKMQKALAKKLGLKIVHKWSDYPDFVPEYMFTYHDFRKRKIGEAR